MIGKVFNTPSVLHKLNKKNFAVNEKALKLRIKSVSSIAKITKAMKMVSSSKMRAELLRLQNGKNFATSSFDKIFASDTYMQKKTNSLPTPQKILYVPFSSDKGLCGGINSNIVREVKNNLNHSQFRSHCGIYIIGEKATSGLSRSFADILKKGVHELQTPINYTTAASIAHDISEVGKDYDRIVLVFNTFRSAINTEITKVELLPRPIFLDLMAYGKKYDQKSPDKPSSNPALYDLYIASNVYHGLLNNIASEQSARMNAMENASKNAKEIVEKLQLQYNKARQAKITMELVEIISGASAV